jgi:hypothetical protein
MLIKKLLTNISMTAKIMNWFKGFFKKKQPKWAYVEPAYYVPEYGDYEELTTQEILDKYGDLLSEEDKQELRKLTAPNESEPFPDSPDELMISDFINAKNK